MNSHTEWIFFSCIILSPILELIKGGVFWPEDTCRLVSARLRVWFPVAATALPFVALQLGKSSQDRS